MDWADTAKQVPNFDLYEFAVIASSPEFPRIRGFEAVFLGRMLSHEPIVLSNCLPYPSYHVEAHQDQRH